MNVVIMSTGEEARKGAFQRRNGCWIAAACQTENSRWDYSEVEILECHC